MSKKVLLIGGYGGLGYEVAKVFAENNWEVWILDKDNVRGWCDQIEEFIPNIEHINLVRNPGVYPHIPAFQFQRAEVDAIVFLAETNDINASHDDILVKNNVATPTYIASNLAHSKCKRLVVVGWQENFGNFNLLTRTLKERIEYTSFFNKGNNVISHMLLPRLIGPYHHHRTFGNIVKRVYKYLSNKQMPVGIEEEISLDTPIKDIRPLDPISYMSSRNAAICVYNQACRNTRAYENPSLYDQYREFPLSIAKYVAWSLEISSAEFRTDKDSHNIDSVSIMPHKEVQVLIEECFNVWDRGRETDGNQESPGGVSEPPQ